ncbi:membrane protein [Modestobacter lapidis]
MSVQVELGLSPWDMLHSGLSQSLGLSFGVVVMVVGLIVLGLSWVLGQRPGLGTLFNVVAVGWVLDRLLETSWLDDLPAADTWVRVLVLVAAVVLLGFGSALYIGARFGAGPRDSLMVACHHHGLSIGTARVAIEVTVLVAGWLLGGALGLGTVLLALATGPAVQLSFRLLGQDPPARRRTPPTGPVGVPPRPEGARPKPWRRTVQPQSVAMARTGEMARDE